MRTLLVGLALTCGLGAAPPSDVVFRAMADELKRSMEKLRLENLDRPYFIAYKILEIDGLTTEGSFGALTIQSPRRHRYAAVEVRVGDYQRDNSNFFALRTAYSGVVGGFAEGGLTMPLDDDYDEIRRQLWLSTDAAYKQALDDFSKKKAALENRNRSGDAADFSREKVTETSDLPPAIAMDKATVQKLVKDLSALFRKTAGIDNSTVGANWENHTIRYLNSEGSWYHKRDPRLWLLVTADTQAGDGMTLANFDSVYVKAISDFPSYAQLSERIGRLQTHLLALKAAPLEDRYVGPVLFSGAAAADLIRQTLAGQITAQPRIVVDDMRMQNAFGGEENSLIDRLGGRVLPEFLSLVDDAASKEYKGMKLLGGYPVDEEAVAARRNVIVENGMLKMMLHGRGLIRGATESSGNQRPPGPCPTNLILEASKGMNDDQLKAELIRVATARNRPYGILVRSIVNPVHEAFRGRGRTMVFTRGGLGASVEVAPLIAAYRVYPDGREELVRNLTVTGMTIANFRDILAASDRQEAVTGPFRQTRYSPLNRGPIFDFQPWTTVVAPALLFEELTMQKPIGEIPKPPVTPHPYFEKSP